jgi:hypothetical protein
MGEPVSLTLDPTDWRVRVSVLIVEIYIMLFSHFKDYRPISKICLEYQNSFVWDLSWILDLALWEVTIILDYRPFSGIFLEYQISFFWNLSQISDLVLLKSFSNIRSHSLRADNQSWLRPNSGNFSWHKVRVYSDVFLQSLIV